MTFSEFGRRVNQNSSGGTDHGTAAPLFLVGDNVAGGIFGKNPDLSDLDNAGDIKFKYDFRQLYATLLVDQLGMPADRLPDVLERSFETLPLISTSNFGPHGPLAFQIEQNYPNPFNPATTINYSIRTAGSYSLDVFSPAGDKVTTLVNGHQDVGNYSVQFDGRNYPSGVYFASIRSGAIKQTIKMMLVK
jgi:hypothetical protein